MHIQKQKQQIETCAYAKAKASGALYLVSTAHALLEVVGEQDHRRGVPCRYDDVIEIAPVSIKLAEVATREDAARSLRPSRILEAEYHHQCLHKLTTNGMGERRGQSCQGQCFHSYP